MGSTVKTAKLEAVRLHLDRLVDWREIGGWSRADEAAYGSLCEMEAELLAQCR